MSATTHAGGAGVVLGIAAVLLAQQFSLLDLSQQGSALVDLVVGAFVGGILFGLVGWRLGRRYKRLHPAPVVQWKSGGN